MSSDEKKKDGISLRTIHICLIVGAVVFSGLMFYATYQLSASFRQMAEIPEQQIELRQAALELMDASDYLTENVQRFTVAGDRQFMDAYFNEALQSQRREEAVERMSAEYGSTAARAHLQHAMNSSVELMDREYYAMRLVIEAKGYTDYPELLQNVTLTDADRALSAEEKMHRATEMVLDDEYYAQKAQIRDNMRASLSELEQMAHDQDAYALETLHIKLEYVRILLLLQTVGAIFLVWLTSRLGIHPILNAVERIKENSNIPVIGANEFRYLARTYNKMFDVYRRSLKQLNYKASHDELTGVYNRAGYELLLSGVDPKTTQLLLFDVDNFKGINDTYGHETGDRVLQKLVKVLQNHFRTEDHICRIGGDEFVVLMVHASEIGRDLLGTKIEEINRELEETDDGLPAVSISVGITSGADVAEPDKLFEHADDAMYRSKKKGKRTYTFSE